WVCGVVWFLFGVVVGGFGVVGVGLLGLVLLVWGCCRFWVCGGFFCLCLGGIFCVCFFFVWVFWVVGFLVVGVWLVVGGGVVVFGWFVCLGWIAQFFVCPSWVFWFA
ncbi:hypothetical protein RA269_27890, partial [Pseudomonas syringae pv. tagetis]|uniref:hypothetical protein n=1 Tax=Pseudomonas syringae group genomosp. 7 TaxID=251699 RepID=UPI00376F9C46